MEEQRLSKDKSWKFTYYINLHFPKGAGTSKRYTVAFKSENEFEV